MQPEPEVTIEQGVRGPANAPSTRELRITATFLIDEDETVEQVATVLRRVGCRNVEIEWDTDEGDTDG